MSQWCRASLSKLDLQALANISWSFANLLVCDPLLGCVDLWLSSSPVLESHAWEIKEVARYSNHLCQLLWAFSFTKCLSSRLSAHLQHKLLETGRKLDQRLPHGTHPTFMEEPLALPCPVVVERLRGILVIYKPPNWEVDAKSSATSSARPGGPGQLSQFLRSEGSQVLGLRDFENGFIHRLDVPSSGLILAATTFEGLAFLQWQMHRYSISPKLRMAYKYI